MSDHDHVEADGDDDDELDGCCGEDLVPDPTEDDQLDGVVLFADLAGTDDLEEIAYRKGEWLTLFGGNGA